MDIEKELDFSYLIRKEDTDIEERLRIASVRVGGAYDPDTGAQWFPDVPTVVVGGVEFEIGDLLEDYDASRWVQNLLEDVVSKKHEKNEKLRLLYEEKRAQMKPGDDREPF